VAGAYWWVDVIDAATASDELIPAVEMYRESSDVSTAADAVEWVRYRDVDSAASASDSLDRSHACSRNLYGYGYIGDVVGWTLGRRVSSTLSASDSITSGKTKRSFHLFMHEGGDISFSSVVSGTMTYDLEVKLQAVI
jgi:hypothetical protein